ncbi:MAG: hypothetical protein A3H32_19790 [Betaproteobacteria bacterium RIFCSPLOWO2_02_FULL_63_19]|nr:MAG: hypothetical protein A3H32_19790 [Betaproteobacteria bacterium RIFCSPLOWO2_02_FULL_63_19]
MQVEAAFPARGDATRSALIAAAMEIFARDGFHAASLRGISEAAGTNQALIGYHFRNKEGLYLAVFEHLVAQLRQRIAPIVEQLDAVLKLPDEGLDRDARFDRYLPPLLRLTDGLVALMTKDESDSWAQLVLREQQAPTAAFAIYYEGLMRRVLSLLTQLVKRMRRGDSTADARVLVVAILGQALVFRSARAGVLRVMEWERIGETELAVIQAQIRRSVTAMLATGD